MVWAPDGTGTPPNAVTWSVPHVNLVESLAKDFWPGAFRRRGDITLCPPLMLAPVGRTSFIEHPTKLTGSTHSIFSSGGSPYESRIQKG